MENPTKPKEEIDYNHLRTDDGQCGGLGTTDETFGPYTAVRNNADKVKSRIEQNPKN